ncbi:MAG TPA: PEP-CTERM sorting domain-containing protein, partial [Rhodanobacter sp.]|nr:PEP-CTERM sorting domain-containing protein [Rhodanobacter sp.]
PATKGWFYFTPQTMSVPEPGSLGSLGLGLALLSFGFAWDKRWRNKRIKGTEEMPMGRSAIA